VKVQGRSSAKPIASSICCIFPPDKTVICCLRSDFGMVAISSRLTTQREGNPLPLKSARREKASNPAWIAGEKAIPL